MAALGLSMTANQNSIPRELVYDVDEWTDVAVIDEIVAAEVGLCFGPDTLVEARNRGYTLAKPGHHRRHRKPRA